MESGKIADSQVTASSEWNSVHGASNARLNFVKNSGSWSSKRNDLKQWLQVDFKYRATITDILTQGRGRSNQWVRSYTVSYSNDGASFKPYQKSGKDKVWFTLLNINLIQITMYTIYFLIISSIVEPYNILVDSTYFYQESHATVRLLLFTRETSRGVIKLYNTLRISCWISSLFKRRSLTYTSWRKKFKSCNS